MGHSVGHAADTLLVIKPQRLKIAFWIPVLNAPAKASASTTIRRNSTMAWPLCFWLLLALDIFFII